MVVSSAIVRLYEYSSGVKTPSQRAPGCRAGFPLQITTSSSTKNTREREKSMKRARGQAPRCQRPSTSPPPASLGERSLQELGSLQGRLPRECDRCEWRYRNAQPIFVRERWFALIGDELIEGTLSEDRLSERRRIGLSR
jgi:hypothetical protein